MRLKFIILLFFISLLSLGNFAYASPEINNLTVLSQEIWLGETEIIFLNCTDDNGSAISGVYADINTSTALFPGNSFIPDANSTYYLSISTAESSNFNKVGIFDVIIYCENELGESVNSSISFTVSNLSIEISSMASPIYIGDMAEISIFVKKDGNTITSNDVSFSVSMNDETISFASQPYYDFEKGWVLKFETDALVSASYILSISADYSGAEVSINKDVDIIHPLDFSITDVDKDWVSSGDTITATLKATYRGIPITILDNYISVRLDSTKVDVFDISSSSASNAYDLVFELPSLSAGRHKIKVDFDDSTHTAQDSENIMYIISASGVIFSDTGNHKVDISFDSGSLTKDVRTDLSGKYSISFPPDTYDIQVEDNFAVLDIFDADIEDFDDPVKYQSLPAAHVGGISGEGVFYYAIASELDYSSADIKIKYDPAKINDLSSMEVYVCYSWNTGNWKCSSEWIIISSVIDSLRKTATIADAVLDAAYIVGNRDSLNLGATLEKESFNINEDISITGLSQDSSKDIVPDAILNASIEATSITASSVSDSNGLFSFNIKNPGVEGNYTLLVELSKDPYISSQKQIDFEIVKSKDISVVSSDTVRLNPGESSEVQFLVINTGEADLSNISISLKNIPVSYYQMIYPETIDILKESNDIPVIVYFTIPENATAGITSASFELSSAGFSKEHSFVMNILPLKNETLDTASVSSDTSETLLSFDLFPSIGMPTGQSLSIIAPGGVMSLAAFAFISISTAILFRRRRLINIYNQELRKINRQMIFDIRNNMFQTKKTKQSMASRKEKNRSKPKKERRC
ncbi:MAG: hypothetical protein KAS90_05880 [Candidatus Aenigmarchaeota archaeon]|nr:hypothetical protein [Candidatus Aenigmarchaeota archaeon]